MPRQPMRPALCLLPLALMAAACVHAEDLPGTPGDAGPEAPGPTSCSTEEGAEIVAALPTEVLGMSAGLGYTYWAVRDSAKPKPGIVSRVKVDGGPVEDFAAGDYAPHALYVDPKLSSVFW